MSTPGIAVPSVTSAVSGAGACTRYRRAVGFGQISGRRSEKSTILPMTAPGGSRTSSWKLNFGTPAPPRAGWPGGPTTGGTQKVLRRDRRYRLPCGVTGTGTTLSPMSPAARRSPVRAALAVIAVVATLLVASPAPAFAGPGIPPGESVTRTFTYEVRTRGTVYADVNVFKRIAAQTLNDRRG